MLLPFRPITPIGENMYVVSNKPEARKNRGDAEHQIIYDESSYPTLTVEGWFFHSDGREFSLREYARIQDFPDTFKFVGTRKTIKQQIGNAIDVKMAEHVAKMIPQSNALSLFSGCGGMDLGFSNVRHNIVLSTDWDIYCAYTHKANFPQIPFILKDIHKLTKQDIQEHVKENINLVIGGPPCQGFSLAGLRFKDDPRNVLYKQFMRIISELKPQYFVMENVMGILDFKQQILEDMQNEGYIVEVKIVKGEEIGIRQKRHRVFFIGQRLEAMD